MYTRVIVVILSVACLSYLILKKKFHVPVWVGEGLL